MLGTSPLVSARLLVSFLLSCCLLCSWVHLRGWHVLPRHVCMADGTVGLLEISAWWRTTQGRRARAGPGVVQPGRMEKGPSRPSLRPVLCQESGMVGPRGAGPPFLFLRVPSLLTGLLAPACQAEALTGCRAPAPALGHLQPCTLATRSVTQGTVRV